MALTKSLQSQPNPFRLLPPELLVIILEHAWDRHNSVSSVITSLCLVCSTWRPAAQRILFTEVRLESEWSAGRFWRSLKVNNSLGNATRIIDFWYFLGGKDPGGNLIGYITEMCPYLFQLILNLRNDIPLSNLLDLLDHHTYRYLQALNLTLMPTSGGKLTLRDTLDFLGKFSSLRHLSLPGLSPVEISDPSTFPPSPSYQLYEFAWEADGTNQTVFPFVQDWLFGGETPIDLQIFQMNDPWDGFHPPETPWVSFLQRHGADLRSLRLYLNYEDLLESEINLSKTCPNLQELILPHTALYSPLRELIPVNHLEHLVFLTDWIPDMKDDLESEIVSGKEVEKEVIGVVEWILSLPKIHHIVVLQADSRMLQLPFPQIWEKCHLRGIDLQVVPDGGYIEPIVDDMIPTLHFPRGRTVANISKMITPWRSKSGGYSTECGEIRCDGDAVSLAQAS